LVSRTSNLRHLLNPGDSQAGVPRDATEAILIGLPLKEQCIVRLLCHRRATQWEVAGALGISTASLRRLLRRCLKRARDPVLAALLDAWSLLETGEQRLVYLHRVLGLSLREIARRGIADPPATGGTQPAATLSTLRRRMRRIERKGARLARREARTVGSVTLPGTPAPPAAEGPHT
jgi:predicted DNA-binding protein (UPF0251 family)